MKSFWQGYSAGWSGLIPDKIATDDTWYMHGYAEGVKDLKERPKKRRVTYANINSGRYHYPLSNK